MTLPLPPSTEKDHNQYIAATVCGEAPLFFENPNNVTLLSPQGHNTDPSMMLPTNNKRLSPSFPADTNKMTRYQSRHLTMLTPPKLPWMKNSRCLPPMLQPKIRQPEHILPRHWQTHTSTSWQREARPPRRRRNRCCHHNLRLRPRMSGQKRMQRHSHRPYMPRLKSALKATVFCPLQKMLTGTWPCPLPKTTAKCRSSKSTKLRCCPAQATRIYSMYCHRSMDL